jgi:hypothetical protein
MAFICSWHPSGKWGYSSGLLSLLDLVWSPLWSPTQALLISVVTCIYVTIVKAWIGNPIYWTLIIHNYK